MSNVHREVCQSHAQSESFNFAIYQSTVQPLKVVGVFQLSKVESHNPGCRHSAFLHKRTDAVGPTSIEAKSDRFPVLDLIISVY